MECLICKFVGKDLSSHIRHKHNITVQQYKEKYNVLKVAYHSKARRLKNSLSQKGKKISKETILKRSKTLKEKFKSGDLVSWQSGKTKENNKSIAKMAETQRERLKDPKEREKISKGLKKSHNEGKWKSWCYGLTKQNDERVKKLAKKTSEIIKNNPKLQINYRMAQIRKKGNRFGGEAKFEWCLNKAGFKENIDYVYNKPLKLKDNKKTRYFYPDFLLKNQFFVEIDGPCHFEKNGDRVKNDYIREEILKNNGYRKFMRIKHEKLFDKKFLHELIEELSWWKINLKNQIVSEVC